MDFKRVIGLNLISKRGQVTIFIIIAIIVIAAVAAFFIFRSNLPATTQISQEFQPAYNAFLSCLQNNILSGINILESQGGYIYLPQFQPGSSYMPFSSQLNFLGNPIPYWFYVSGNNIAENQVPSQSDMQNQLAQYIDQHARNCDFGTFTDQNFVIQMGNPTASVIINSDQVQVSLNMNLNMNKGNDSVFVSNHKVNVNSELGNLYQSALTLYNYEQSTLFLENYTIDVLRNYAPVDGVELTCSPLTWNANDVVSNLSQAIQDNILTLRTGNDINYFAVHAPVQNVRFITSPNWPSDYEINPSQGDLLIAQPIGNQNGLGILGFCYVPYHFVYDVKYPVLATISNNGEIFQFPMAVIIQGNMPRNSLNGTAVSTVAPVLCKNENTPILVNVFDSNSNPIGANISYECFSEACNIGQTTSGVLSGNFPQCENGYIVASANGFATGRSLFTTTRSGSVSILLNKLYNETIDLTLDGQLYIGNAMITLTSSDGTTQTIIYPQQTSIQLSQGDYSIQVYIYRNSSITIAATTTQQCVNVASPGILGALGTTQQQCFNLNLPAQVISNALAGGGQAEYFALNSNLQNSNTIQISATSLPVPNSLNQLQNNYLLFGNKTLSINLIQNAQ
jgi:hypothetical protein